MADEDADDAMLLTRVAAGDQRAFGELFDRHANAVLRYAWSRAGSSADAQELLQETFITAWDRRAKIRLVGASVLPWLLVTCRNHASNLARRNATRASLPLRDADIMTPTFDELWIHDAIDRLDAVDRRLCKLCLIDGMTYREAAHELGMSVAAVGKRLERARITLRREVTDSER